MEENFLRRLKSITAEKAVKTIPDTIKTSQIGLRSDGRIVCGGEEDGAGVGMGFGVGGGNDC